jgi:hypothetical protein
MPSPSNRSGVVDSNPPNGQGAKPPGDQWRAGAGAGLLVTVRRPPGRSVELTMLDRRGRVNTQAEGGTA